MPSHPRLRRLIMLSLVAASLLSSAGSLAYSLELVRRIALGGVGRLGADVITAAYALALGSFVIAVAARLLMITWSGASRSSRTIIPLAALALSGWLILHLGGVVYSHDSLFVGRVI